MHPNFFQLGRLQIPVFGVFAALGLMAALALSQRAARYARIDPAAVWNAATATVVAAFVISRVLLIAFNWHGFLQYPLLLLSLPSFTSVGVLLTGLFLIAYLRARRLPLLRFLDASAPCLSLLWAFLSAGRFAEGTRGGMATRLPWGMSDGTIMKVHPVELYTLAAAGVLCTALLRVLRRQSMSGRAAGIGLMLAGLAIYLVDFFRLPSDLLADAWIEPAQAAAMVMIAAGATLAFRQGTTIQEATGNEGPDAV